MVSFPCAIAVRQRTVNNNNVVILLIVGYLLKCNVIPFIELSGILVSLSGNWNDVFHAEDNLHAKILKKSIIAK